MARILFGLARLAGYQKVRLDLASEQRQPQAMRFYPQLGFYSIERYNDSSCTVFMEKLLMEKALAPEPHTFASL
ncbi:MAG: hypothetical protein ACKO7W_08125 [Elainella sp.]